ncbi:hypothetical protein MKZ38_002698 [Zalerion maritima]|uniref:Aurora kinase n=1 Tax=Zalerion maritima TaxID=339359 RepID=A0AAD5RPL8_9PEZI|nr:hypothetical protein MKZ38_002698 [Zalerion maritima]
MAAAPVLMTPLAAPFNKRDLSETQLLKRSFLNRIPQSTSRFQNGSSRDEHSQMPPPPARLHLGMFQVGKPLGKGKFGRVYLVKHRKSGFVCVLKVLKKDEIQRERAEVHVRREIEVHQNLRHPNIVGFLGWFHDSRRVFIMLEFAAGGELYKVLRKENTFSERKAAKYIAQVAESLHYMHKKNIMHRDLKPENILVGVNGELKLADFGYSVHAPSDRRETLCGTLDYLPPEMLRGPSGAYTKAVDLWSLGVLTYEFLTGEAPFEDSMAMTRRRIVKGDMKPLPSYVSREAKDFVHSLLILDGSKRISLSRALKHPWIVKHCGDRG